MYGLERLSEVQTVNNVGNVVSYYGYDGHGSVRDLTNASGAVTDTYDYDAFGNLIASTGSTPNNFLFAGEQFDRDLGLYYNRARYLDAGSGRFWSIDTAEPLDIEPQTLHRYLYAAGDPVDLGDPSGMAFTATFGYAVEREVRNEYRSDFPSSAGFVSFSQPIRDFGLIRNLRPDIFDRFYKKNGKRLNR